MMLGDCATGTANLGLAEVGRVPGSLLAHTRGQARDVKPASHGTRSPEGARARLGQHLAGLESPTEGREVRHGVGHVLLDCRTDVVPCRPGLAPLAGAALAEQVAPNAPQGNVLRLVLDALCAKSGHRQRWSRRFVWGVKS